MSRPSEPLLAVLRGILKARGLSSSQAARAASIDKARMRRVLSGADPMTVDELLQLSSSLELSPAELGLPDDAVTSVEKAPDEATPAAPAVVDGAPPDDPAPATPDIPVVDPWGNHPRQLFEVGFRLGVDFGFECDADQLADSGLPGPVLSRHRGGSIFIQLDSAYHDYNAPELTDDHAALTLSFDKLYRCRLPWGAVKRVVFVPAPPQDTLGGDAEDDDQPHGPPVLRLVT